MDFDFTAEQQLLRDSARRFLERHCGTETVRALMQTDNGFAPQFWQEMAGLGWLGLTLPEVYGGMNGNFLDLAVVLEEVGRNLVPGPFVETVVVLPEALLAAGTAAQKQRYLPLITAGKLKGALAFLESTPRWDEEGIQLTASLDGRLNGEKQLVTWAGQADLILVPARVPEHGVSLFLVRPSTPGVTLTLTPSTDMAARQYRLQLREARGEPLGAVGAGWNILSPILLRAAVATSMDIIGGARRVLEITVDYARQRVQFDRPIGSFQALKHTMANMYIRLENCCSAAYYGALTISENLEDVEPALHRAKAHASDTGRWIAERAMQIHGGIGFTWEHDLHLFLKRAMRLEMLYGAASYHRERLAEYLF